MELHTNRSYKTGSGYLIPLYTMSDKDNVIMCRMLESDQARHYYRVLYTPMKHITIKRLLGLPKNSKITLIG